jgi:hypothetical protein
MGIAASQSAEARRQKQQTRLDTLKTAGERNKWGQFATPPELALSLARYARALTGQGGGIRFLDPAIGTGSFYSALRQAFSPQEIDAATGIELDPLFANAARDLWGDSGLNIVRGDFTKRRPDRHFNLILTNPPYVRHHHLSAAEKNRLKTLLAGSLHTEISGLAGLYCYFLLLCHDWMEELGLAIWLIPSEFMDVNYGSALRRYLTERVTLLRIHRFSPTDVQFTDALVSSAIVVFWKAPPSSGHGVRFSFAGPIEQPRSEAIVPLDVLRRSRKWTQYPGRTDVESTGEPTLGDIFRIKRGLATGSNSFFILSPEEARHPFRFIWNRSQATAHNVYLMLYPKGPVAAVLKNHPELEESMFQALQKIAPTQILSEGRVYGGGLHQVEPKELPKFPHEKCWKASPGMCVWGAKRHCSPSE